MKKENTGEAYSDTNGEISDSVLEDAGKITEQLDVELEKRHTTYKNVIKEMADSYQQIADTSKGDEADYSSKIADNLYAHCPSENGPHRSPSNPTPQEVLEGSVGAMGMIFYLNGFYLSSELIYACLTVEENAEISPIWGGRVLDSHLTWNFLDGSKEEDTLEFLREGNAKEKDLFYSLHKAKIDRVGNSSQKAIISDDYNMDTARNFNFFISTAMNVVEQAHRLNVVHYYHIAIHIDVSKFARVSYVAENDNTVTLRVRNPDSVNRTLYYTQEMVSADKIGPWNSVDTLKIKELKGNESVEFEVKKGSGGNVGFAFLRDYNLYITGGEVIEKRFIEEEFTKKCYFKNGFFDIGKSNGDFLIIFENLEYVNLYLKYNKKLCHLQDAEDWVGLKDLDEVRVYAKNRFTFRVSPNGDATYFAVQYELRDSYYRFAVTCPMGNTVPILHRIDKYYYLQLSIDSKSGNTWQITVKNPTSKAITVDYNEKMCNEGDAKSWNGLNDLKKINLLAKSKATVSVTENWFATCIAFSYLSDSRRIITYADRLNAQTKELASHNLILL